MKKLLPLGALLLLLTSCSKNGFLLDRSAEIKHVGVHLKFEPDVPNEIQAELKRNLEEFVIEYNTGQHRLKSFVSTLPNSSTITFHIYQTKLVKSGEQIAGVLITAAGLSLPFIMISSGAEFAVFFYYFPRAVSLSEVVISDDISEQDNQKIQYAVSSPAFLRKRERQIQRHGDYFKRSLKYIFRNMEQSLEK